MPTQNHTQELINKIPSEWHKYLNSEFDKTYFRDLSNFVHNEYQTKTIFPPKEKIFKALELCSPENLKIIIIGQDPYHKKGQAHGLAFSVPEQTTIPPSLRNIFKELNSDIGKPIPKSGDLTHWAKQGILLINSIFTVEEAKASSHKNKGWEIFTQALISSISQNNQNLIFILWGNFARQMKSQITDNNHLILESAHPSPLSASRGFFGNKHFSISNNFLKRNKKNIIIW